RLRLHPPPEPPRERRLRILSRTRRPASLAGLREGRQLSNRLRDLSQSDAFARLRLRDLPSAHLPREDRCALERRAREAARGRGPRARAAPDPGRLRRIERLPELPRQGVRDVAGEPP